MFKKTVILALVALTMLHQSKAITVNDYLAGGKKFCQSFKFDEHVCRFCCHYYDLDSRKAILSDRCKCQMSKESRMRTSEQPFSTFRRRILDAMALPPAERKDLLTKPNEL